jgi:hypothetical protein
MVPRFEQFMHQKFFYIEHLHQVEGPVKCRRLFEYYRNGHIHDRTLIWDSSRRHWYPFIELRWFYTMTFRPTPENAPVGRAAVHPEFVNQDGDDIDDDCLVGQPPHKSL